MESMIKQWSTLLDRCLDVRIPADTFAAVVNQLHAKYPLPGSKLAMLLLRPRSAEATHLDPRVIIYLEQLLVLRKVDAADVLASSFLFSKDRPSKAGEDGVPKETQTNNPPELDEIIFHRLHKAFAAEERPVDNSEGIRTLLCVTRWMQAMVTSHTSENMIQAVAGIQQQPQQQSINVREGLAMLVVGVIENPRILRILHHPKGKGLRRNFSQSLSSFIPFLSHNSVGSQNSIQLASRLEISQKQHDFYDKLPTANGEMNENAGLEVAAMQLESVLDLPLVNTRAGMFIFLNSLLVARPLTDEFLIINFLHARYKLEPQTMAIDLITGSFDVLANAMYRSEPSSTMFHLKAFLINKVPLLLTQLATSIFPMTPELSITQALSHVDPNAFPAFSQGFDDMMGNSNSLSDVRQDFLNACALHSLIPTTTIERLLGEAPLQGPPETKYEKKQLLETFKHNFDKVSMYIDEIENLDGNAGAIVGAMTEFVSHLCETQGTMYLKQLSSLMFKKPQAMDVMLLFTSPAGLLQPLCQFLDDWHYDSDQGECQPVYDEFGAILVLVMAFILRYDLTAQCLGLSHDTFIARLIARGHSSILPSDLTDDQAKHLGIWLKGLFDADMEGLSNDVFTSCRPQDFYLLVPTLFSQTVIACSCDVLSFETVKGGLEYLGETFLMPSLIGGLSWMASYALEQTHNDLDALMRIFKEVMLAAHSSADAQAMHATILAAVSSRLDQCFRTLQRRDPNRKDIEILLQSIKGTAHYERSGYSSLKELEQWTNAPHSTLPSALRHTVQQLAQWASTAALQPNPPSYTQRQVNVTWKIIGAHKALRAIVDETKAQTEAGNGAAALDIATCIVCAPTVEDSPMAVDANAPAPFRARANLREMLKSDFDNAASLVSTDASTAETIVRLHRRVEAQLGTMSELSLQARAIDIPNVDIGDIAAQAIDDAAVASMVENLENNKTLQQSMEELTNTDVMDLASLGIGTDAGGDLGADLGSLPGLDLSEMGMDMEMDMGMGGEGEDDWGLNFDDM